MDWTAFREQFPAVTEQTYLNAGTCGPVPRASADAIVGAVERFTREGRSGNYFEIGMPAMASLRAAYAAVVGARTEDVALTTGTSEGLARVVRGIGLRPGDELLTSVDDYPGLRSILDAAAAQVGGTVRAVPIAELADAVRPSTRLVACSHVHWQTGQLAPEIPAGPVVLLDGAQSVGAVPVDVTALRCDFYAGPGQKWLCGPAGTGFLWVSPEWEDRLAATAPTYINLEDPVAGLAGGLHPGAARHDAPAPVVESWLGALASLEVLGAPGWDAVHARAAALAALLADVLVDAGRTVVPRDRTTLVAFADPTPIETRDRLAAAGIVVRDLPGTPWLRASVGAWSDPADIDALVAAL
jgi:L-cysteine/cystine lyase